MRRRADTLNRLKDISFGLHLEQTTEHALAAIAQGIRDSTPFRVVLASVYESDTGMLRRAAGVGIKADTMNELLARKQLYTSLQQLMKPEFRISRSYYIPADQTPILPADLHFVYSTYEVESAPPKEQAWRGTRTTSCSCRSRTTWGIRSV
jgi:hypothetical protein